MENAAGGKKTLGRRKIEIKKIEKKTSLQVTFSKRRKSLFRKAAELSVTCGTDVAILVQSPAGNVFAFGNPSVSSVLDRLERGQILAPEELEEAEEKRKECEEAETRLMNEKRLMKDCCKEQNWWKEPEIEVMELDELEGLVEALEGLRDNAMHRIDEKQKVPLMIELPQDHDQDTSVSSSTYPLLDYQINDQFQDSNDLKGEMDSLSDQSLQIIDTTAPMYKNEINTPPSDDLSFYFLTYNPIDDDQAFVAASDPSYFFANPFDQVSEHDYQLSWMEDPTIFMNDGYPSI